MLVVTCDSFSFCGVTEVSARQRSDAIHMLEFFWFFIPHRVCCPRAIPVPGHGYTAARNLQSMAAVIKSPLNQGEEQAVVAAASAQSQADDAENSKWFPAAADRRNGAGPGSDFLEGISCWTIELWPDAVMRSTKWGLLLKVIAHLYLLMDLMRQFISLRKTGWAPQAGGVRSHYHSTRFIMSSEQSD